MIELNAGTDRKIVSWMTTPPIPTLIHDSPIHQTRPRPHGRGRHAASTAFRADDPGARRDPGRDAAAPRARRSRRAARVRAGAPAAQGAARHRAGDRRRARHASTASRASRRRRTATSTSSSIARRLARAWLRGRAGRAAPSRPRARPSSSTRPSTRTRRRTSATCATPRSATRSAGCCASSAARSRSRTTSTTPASRSPTWPSASASSSTRRSTTSARIADADAVRLLLLGSLRARHRVVRGGQDAAEDPRRGAARHRARRQRHRRPRRVHRRSHRPRATSKTMRRLNIGYDLLTWEGDILRLHFWTHAFEFLKKTGAVFLQTEGKLKGCWVMRIDERPAPAARTPSEAAGAGGGPATDAEADAERAAREGHRPIRRHRDLRRQGHGVPAVEVRPARQGLPLPRLRGAGDAAALVDDVRSRRRPTTARRRSGAASWVCNVIDTRQSYLQKLLKQALAALGYQRAGGALDPLRVRDGRAVARDRARAGLRHERRRGPAVRRGVGPQGPRRQGRRPARSADRQGRGRSREAQPRAAGRRRAARSPRRSPSRRSATSW